jgi:hypothetical protein
LCSAPGHGDHEEGACCEDIAEDVKALMGAFDDGEIEVEEL